MRIVAGIAVGIVARITAGITAGIAVEMATGLAAFRVRERVRVAGKRTYRSRAKERGERYRFQPIDFERNLSYNISSLNRLNGRKREEADAFAEAPTRKLPRRKSINQNPPKTEMNNTILTIYRWILLSAILFFGVAILELNDDSPNGAAVLSTATAQDQGIEPVQTLPDPSPNRLTDVQSSAAVPALSAAVPSPPSAVAPLENSSRQSFLADVQPGDVPQSGGTNSKKNKTNLTAPGTKIEGIVVHVADGDTFNLRLDGGVVITIRAQAMDAPEKGQEHGNISREIMRRGLLNKKATVVFDKMDSYNRYVGRIYRGNIDVEQEMIRKGHAWHFDFFNKEPKLAEAQKEAQRRQVGLWKGYPEIQPEAPWEYRKKKKGGYALPRNETPVQPGEEFWLSKSGTLHNDSCKNYKNTKNGRLARPDEGKDCKACGGSRRNIPVPKDE